MATARSLHVGVNVVSASSYPDGYFRTLFGCDLAAQFMESLAGLRAIPDRRILATHQDTKLEVIEDWFKAAAYDSKAGDLVLFTYAGHGDSVPDLDGDEKSDQALVFYDTELVDDQIHRMLTEFRRDVFVVLVADSCYGGSVASILGQRQRMHAPSSAVIQRLHPATDLWTRLSRSAENADDVMADVLLLSASAESGIAQGSEAPNLLPRFTRELKDAWAKRSGLFPGGYRELADATSATLNVSLLRNKRLATEVQPFAIP